MKILTVHAAILVGLFVVGFSTADTLRGLAATPSGSVEARAGGSTTSGPQPALRGARSGRGGEDQPPRGESGSSSAVTGGGTSLEERQGLIRLPPTTDSARGIDHRGLLAGHLWSDSALRIVKPGTLTAEEMAKAFPERASALSLLISTNARMRESLIVEARLAREDGALPLEQEEFQVVSVVGGGRTQHIAGRARCLTAGPSQTLDSYLLSHPNATDVSESSLASAKALVMEASKTHFELLRKILHLGIGGGAPGEKHGGIAFVGGRLLAVEEGTRAALELAAEQDKWVNIEAEYQNALQELAR